MDKSISISETLKAADAIRLELQPSRAKLVNEIRWSIQRVYGCSARRLFSTGPHSRHETARMAFVLALRSHVELQLEKQWIMRYLRCHCPDIESYLRAGRIRLVEDKSFAQRFARVRAEFSIKLEECLKDHAK